MDTVVWVARLPESGHPLVAKGRVTRYYAVYRK